MFDGLTTGTLVADRFYYIPNTQIDKKDAANQHLNPLQIWAIELNVLDRRKRQLYTSKWSKIQNALLTDVRGSTASVTN